MIFSLALAARTGAFVGEETVQVGRDEASSRGRAAQRDLR